MMTKFSNGYLKKDRVWFVHECKTPGWEAMLCTDGGGDTYVRISEDDLPALTSGLTELMTTDDRKVWVNVARVMSIVNLAVFYQLTLANGHDFDVVDVSALLEAIE